MSADITTRIVGKRVAAVLSNGHVLQIRTACGAELEIVWLDDNGRPSQVGRRHPGSQRRAPAGARHPRPDPHARHRPRPVGAPPC